MRDTETIDIGELIREMWRERTLFFICLIISVVLAFILTLFVSKRYESEVLLMPSRNDQQASALPSDLLSLGSLAGIRFGSEGSLKGEAIAILESKQFIRDFVNEKKLMTQLFPERWDETGNSWLDDERPTINEAIIFFQETVYSVRELPNNDMVLLTVVWTDAEIAAAWASELVHRLNETLRKRAVSDSEMYTKFLQQQLEETSNVELRQVIFGLLEDQIRARMLAQIQKEYAFTVIDPPVVSDQEEYISPNLVMYLIGGVFAGALVGFILFSLKSIRRSVN